MEIGNLPDLAEVALVSARVGDLSRTSGGRVPNGAVPSI